jgi:hypothetical protein
VSRSVLRASISSVAHPQWEAASSRPHPVHFRAICASERPRSRCSYDGLIVRHAVE